MSVLIALLPTILGLLGEFLAAFLTNWEASHAADPNVAAVIEGYVQSAEANPALASGAEKWWWVRDRMAEWLLAEGKAMTKSMLNTLIELAVNKIKLTTRPS
jgi:hypothetical protein